MKLYRYLLIGLLLLGLCSPVFAQEILFEATEQADITDTDDSVLGRYKAIVNLRSLPLQGESDVLFVLPGAVARAVVNHVSPQHRLYIEGADIWHGVVFDNDTQYSVGELYMIYRDERVQARITYNNQVFLLRAIGADLGVLEEHRPVERDHPRGVAPPVAPESSKVGKLQPDSMCTDTADRIDLMVTYTQDAKEAANTSMGLPANSGPAAIFNEIVAGVGQANLALVNSDALHRFNLVRVDEVNYNESADGGASTTLLDELRNQSDAIMDEVHGWRDESKADLVALITAGGDCGWGYTPQNADADTTDHQAFSVVRRSCLNTNLSLGHETGHNLGALHNREDSSASDFTPPYNHGFQKPSPSSASPWRTNMAYGCSGVSCTRVTQFSNPDIDYPAINGDPTGDPMSDAEPENNVMVFEQNDLQVARYRCSNTNQLAANVWGKDTWADTGLEPDPATAGEPMWRSPYIWVRNSQDVNLEYEHAHQNPDLNEDPHVYVKFQNDGNTTAVGDVELYYADASTSLNSPANWTLINSQNTSIPTGVDVFEFPWNNLPGTGHYCLLARWNDTGTPLSFSNIDDYVRGEGGHIWRNVNIVGAGADQLALTSDRFIMRGGHFDTDSIFLRIETEALDSRPVPWNKIMSVALDFDLKFLGEKPLLLGVKKSGNGFHVPLDNRVKFIGPIILRPEQALKGFLNVERDQELGQKVATKLGGDAHYRVSVQQVRESAIQDTQEPLGGTLFPADLILGGVDYTLRLPAAAQQDLYGKQQWKPVEPPARSVCLALGGKAC